MLEYNDSYIITNNNINKIVAFLIIILYISNINEITLGAIFIY